MTDEGWTRDREFDDWFDEPDTTDASGTSSIESPTAITSDSAADNWLSESAAARRPAHVQPTPRSAVIVGTLLILFLLGVLAAAGVFSRTTHKRIALQTLSTPTPKHPRGTTLTATQPRQVPTVPTAPLKPGDRGPAVQRLQRALEQAGYSTGAIDGVYGTATTQAVTRFQQAHGLTTDGIAGPQTVAALTQALQTG